MSTPDFLISFRLQISIHLLHICVFCIGKCLLLNPPGIPDLLHSKLLQAVHKDSLAHHTNHCRQLTLSHVFVIVSRLSGNCTFSLSFFGKRPSLGLMRARNVVAAAYRSTSPDSRFHSVHVPCLKAAWGNQTKKQDDTCDWLMYRERDF